MKLTIGFSSLFLIPTLAFLESKEITMSLDILFLIVTLAVLMGFLGLAGVAACIVGSRGQRGSDQSGSSLD